MNSNRRVAPVNVLGNAQAIRYRLHKAFPETTKVMPQLSRQLNAGQSWAKAVSGLLSPLPPHRVERLSLELPDLFSMGWSDGEQFDLVLNSIFGLDVEVAERTDGSTWEFVRRLALAIDSHRHDHAATGSAELADRW